MKIGALSDTHDNLDKIKKAVSFFNREKVDLVLHAGDFVAPFAVKEINKLNCGWQGVLGNNDGERAGLKKVSQGRIKPRPLRLLLDNKKILLIHDITKIDPEKERSDIIIYGHTHIPAVIRRPKKLLVNPGECCGWVRGRSSVAVIDLASMTAKIYNLRKNNNG